MVPAEGRHRLGGGMAEFPFDEVASVVVALHRLIGDRDEADDVLDTVIVRWLSLDDAQRANVENRAAYLMRAAHNEYADRQRVRARVIPLGSASDLDRDGLVPVAVRRVDDDVERRLDEAALVVAFASLDSRWQLILRRVDHDRASVADLVTELGISATAVTSLAHRAREGLRVAYLVASVLPARNGACTTVLERLAVAVRAKVTDPHAPSVAAHLDRCPRCRGALVEMRRIDATLPARRLRAPRVGA